MRLNLPYIIPIAVFLILSSLPNARQTSRLKKNIESQAKKRKPMLFNCSFEIFVYLALRVVIFEFYYFLKNLI
jgi:hypothetical protein